MDRKKLNKIAKLQKQLNLLLTSEKDNLKEFKVCSGCKVHKLRTEFSKNKLSKDGLYIKCKSCVKLKNIKYYKKTQEARKRKRIKTKPLYFKRQFKKVIKDIRKKGNVIQEVCLKNHVEECHSCDKIIVGGPSQYIFVDDGYSWLCKKCAPKNIVHYNK